MTSGSGGDRPPINDTAIAFPIDGGDFTEPLWVSRAFDSVYSVAITETAVYIGGHFSWNESPTANQPWPGLDNVGYGTGQGLSGYGLGDQVVRRDHLGALDPETGTALEWNPASNSFEGIQAMLATPRGLFTGGDNSGSVASTPVGWPSSTSTPSRGDPRRHDHRLRPIEGRVVPAGTPFSIQGREGTQGQARHGDRPPNRDGAVPAGRPPDVGWREHHPCHPRHGPEVASVVAPAHPDRNPSPADRHGLREGRRIRCPPAGKTMETFSFDDQTPSTSITGPSSPLTSTAFTMEGSADDDHGVDSLRYWFRDDAGLYLQDDGSVGPIFNTFRGLPDVVGATNATWTYDVVLPHDGTWRGSATAIDTAGQSDLRSSTRDWVISPGATAPVVTIEHPAQVATRTTPLPTVQVEPGQPLTFSGSAMDADGLGTVEVYLRNSTTRENLAADGTWGTDAVASYYRVSPLNLPGQNYSWSYTTPFNASPGVYTFYVRATDDTGLTTGTFDRPGLTVLVQVAGDAAPDTVLSNPGTGQPALPTQHLSLSGSATDDTGVAGVELIVYDQGSGRYLQDNGSLASGFNTRSAVLAAPGATSTGWTFDADLPGAGDFGVTAIAVDASGQWDTSTTGATGRYLYYPGDAPPTFVDGLGQPVTGDAFTEGRIVVTGRADDDLSIAKVETAIVDGSGRYLDSSGNFVSTFPSWRSAFLNSPGSPGSNFSYTSPVVPDGTYTVLVRATDHHGQLSDVRTATGVTVTHPANVAPSADFTQSCTQNVCSFDATASTDETPSTLIYSWTFVGPGGSTTAKGIKPTRTFTAAGTYNVTLTVRDEWGATDVASTSVPIAVPAGNVAPVPVITSQCTGLTCSVTGVNTTDANSGDTISYSWAWDDATPDTTVVSAAHTFPGAGSYDVTLTATDGWGASATATVTLTVAP